MRLSVLPQTIRKANKKLLVLNYEIAMISSVLCQAMYGGGTLLLSIAAAHFAPKAEFARIASGFLVLNLSLGAIMAWQTAKWRDHIGRGREMEVLEESSYSAALLFSLIAGLVIFTYDAVFLLGSGAIAYIILASVVSGAYVAQRRLALLGSEVGRVLFADSVRTVLIILTVIFWSKYGVNFDDFWFGLFFVGLPSSLLMMFSRRGLAVDGSRWKNLLFGNSIRHPNCMPTRLTPQSRSLLKAALFSLVASQIGTIILPAFIPAREVAIVRVYEILFSPLFFAIQAIDPIVSKRMVRLELAKNRELQYRTALLASLGLSITFGLSVAFIYIVDFLDVSSRGIIIPIKYRDSAVVMGYILSIGFIVCLSVGLRWIGVGRHTGLNMHKAIFLALTLSIAVTYGISCASMPLEAAFIGKLTYEGVLLLLLIREMVRT